MSRWPSTLSRLKSLASSTKACAQGAVVVLLVAGVAFAEDAPRELASSRFRDLVAPALAAKCVACHRPDNIKGGFDMTTRAGMLKGGEDGAGLAPGDTAASPIYMRAISHDGLRPEMPEKGAPLTVEEADAMRDWIAANAPWPENLVLRENAKADANFWSWRPLSEVGLPDVPDAPAKWNKNPIDRFLIAKLHARHLQPNRAADAPSFIRRATYDLTGLPPTPEEVAAFEVAAAADGLDAAIEQLIDRLLASPRYGEHWGRHWLDVIRFGESRGYERNEIITNLWPFRDYVIKSFNDDKPFDQLAREHLAGDVIGKDQPEIEIGSAFLVAGPYDDVNNQNPVAAAQIRADQMDEMIRATGEAFLGLTIGCARCHDHKFDPILAKDYYALYATFAGTLHGSREVASAEARAERAIKLRPLEEERSKFVAEKETLDHELQERVKEQASQLSSQWRRPALSRYGTEETFTTVEAKQVRLVVEGTDSPNPKDSQFKLDEFEVWTDEATPRNVALASSGATAQGAVAREAPDFVGAYGVALAIDGMPKRTSLS
jgi:mono/diheme cytochrome c family protein